MLFKWRPSGCRLWILDRMDRHNFDIHRTFGAGVNVCHLNHIMTPRVKLTIEKGSNVGRAISLGMF